MNKTELISTLAKENGIDPETAKTVVEAMFGLMKQQLLEGGRVEIRGFGTFEIRDHEVYTGRNPKTGEPVEVKPKRSPFFKCGAELKRLMNEE